MTRLRKIMLEERQGRKSLRWRLARLGIRRFDPISEFSKLPIIFQVRSGFDLLLTAVLCSS